MLLIGVLCWVIELGRININTEDAILSQYSAQPCKGRLDSLYEIIAYMRKKLKSCIAFDPDEPDVNKDTFNDMAVLDDFYANAEELLPPKMPKEWGKTMSMHFFVDSDNSRNKVTRRSHTGFLIYLQNAPIIWFSKRKNTVEISYFGSKFLAMRIAVERIKALRYKLRMFWVPITSPANVFCGNQGVVKNTSIPDSTLLKKHKAVNYHSVCEAAACGIVCIGKEDIDTNLSDVLMKVLTKGQKDNLISYMLYPHSVCILESHDKGE